MKHTLLISLLFFLAFVPLPAQPPADNSPACSCRENFDWMRQKITNNYAGYQDKVNPQTRPALDVLTQELSRQTEQAADTACLRIMGAWLGFFKDGHLQISNKGGSIPTAPTKPEEVRARFANEPQIALTEAQAKQIFDKKAEKTMPIEGIWRNTEGTYRVAIVSVPVGSNQVGGYAAVILKADSIWWMPGQIKFNLSLPDGKIFKADYFMRDHSRNVQKAFTDGKVLTISTLGLWRKEYPEAVGDEAMANFQSPFDPAGGVPSSKFELKKLDEQTLLLRIPTFNHELRHITDSLLAANKSLLASMPNLIVDVRNNGGGSDISYSKVLPYLYTNPIQVMGTQRWATQDNADKYKLMQHDKNYPTSTRMYAKKTEKKMRRHSGVFLKGKNSTRKMKQVMPYPQKVAVLVNGRCASSCEQFVLAAVQSKKVTLIGSATFGVLDYGNMHFMQYPCQKWTLGWATSRSNRIEAGQGIDNVGIQPQVEPGADAKDWVEFARVYLKSASNNSKN